MSLDKDLHKFMVGELLQELASSGADCGGGTAVLMGAAMGAALYAMAMRVTASHRDGSEKDELEAKALQMDKIYSDILAFAKKDGEAYGFVVDAIRLPKGTEAEIAVRREALQAALKKAALVPMEAAELCLAAIKAGASFLPNCAKPSRSDVAAGTMLLYAGVRGCLLNILQNCKNLSDRGDILERSAEIRKAAEELHSTILKETEIIL